MYKYDYRGGGEIKYSKTGSFNINSFYGRTQQDRDNGSLYNPSNDPSLSNLNPSSYAYTVPYTAQYEAMQYQQYGASSFIKEEMHDWWGDLKDIKVGFDARGSNFFDNNTIYNKPLVADGNTSIFGNIRTSATNAYEGLFAQATFSPKDIPLDVTLGLREDFWQAFDANSGTSNGLTESTSHGVTSLSTHPGVTTLTPSQTFTQFDPRLGLKYSFNSGIDLRGAIYRNYAAPGMNQLYRSYYSGTGAYLSNAALTPESNFGQEVGLDFTHDAFSVKTTAYHNELTNFVQSTQMCTSCTQAQSVSFGVPYTGGSGTINQNQNIGTATFEGGEAFFDWKPLSTLDLNASVVRTWAFLNSFEGSFEKLNKTLSATSAVYLNRQLPNVQPWTITLGGKWDFYQDLSISWSIKSWPAYWTATAASTNALQQNTAATTADMHFNYKANKHVDLYINAQNISNAYYITTNSGSTGTGVPTIGMPRNIMGGFKFVW